MRKILLTIVASLTLAGCVTQPVKIDNVEVTSPTGATFSMEGYQRGEFGKGDDEE